MFISDKYHDPKYHGIIDELLTKTIIHSFYLLNDNHHYTAFNDYPAMLVTLKNQHLSTRSTDADLVRIRELAMRVVKEAADSHVSESLALATRTAVLLYLMLRTVAGKQNV
jgi:hypothetical protein